MFKKEQPNIMFSLWLTSCNMNDWRLTDSGSVQVANSDWRLASSRQKIKAVPKQKKEKGKRPRNKLAVGFTVLRKIFFLCYQW
uniref:Uncharacterized protein n=1 Tax=Anguilla anguilla TaxID=7936 RepID=A0A0E9SBS3_ANGAN